MDQEYQIQNEHEHQQWLEHHEDNSPLDKMRRGTYRITLKQLRAAAESRKEK